MNIKQEIKQIYERLAVLEKQLDEEQYDWNNAPVICQLNEFEYRLGPELPNELTWDEAIDWCKSIGGELPSREVLLMCQVNETIRPNFKNTYYWSSTELLSRPTVWCQSFSDGFQSNFSKNVTYYVRAVQRVAVRRYSL
jgi:hypothetical protein